MASAILSLGAFGDDVRELHDKLRANGFDPPTVEAARAFFGPGTREVLRLYQGETGLASTGSVDTVTRAALGLPGTRAGVGREAIGRVPGPKAGQGGQSEAQAGGDDRFGPRGGQQVRVPQEHIVAETVAAPLEQFVVRGSIIDARLAPVAGVVVRAFDRNLPSLKRDQPLGDAITNDEGAYEIVFGEDRFRAGERGRADVYIEVLGQDDAVLGRSASRSHPDPETLIDITIDAHEPTRHSEYEDLVASLTPLTEPMALADATDDDVEFLVSDTSADRWKVLLVAAAARLARETGVTAQAFYGWSRTRVAPDTKGGLPDATAPGTVSGFVETIRARLAATSTDDLRAALHAAAENNIIPGQIRDRADALALAVVNSQHAQYHAIGRLRDEETGEPLAATVVRILDLSSRPVPEEIGRETTSDVGLFAITFAAPEGPDPATSHLRVTVLDVAGREVWSTDIHVAADQPDVLEFTVPVGLTAARDTLDRVAASLQIRGSSDLLAALADRDIRTLGDIRRTGGLEHVSGLRVDTDVAALRELDAHADLGRLSTDVASNAVLIESGFRSVADIAGTSTADFVNAVREKIGDDNATTMHVAAQAQTAFLSNVVTGLAVDRANGLTAPPTDGANARPSYQPLGQRCGCADCETAVSPTAYLADLLQYAATHLKEHGRKRPLSFLAGTFYQPFGGLPTDCEAVGGTVSQVRICIEVLRAYLKAHPLVAADAALLETATRDYLLAAYAQLLARIGSSYEEVRLARGATHEKRLMLADRLGIDLTEPRPDPATTPGDELDQLFLDPEVPPTNPRALTEWALERLFGLRDSTGDPLLNGVKIGDNDLTPELLRWQIAGTIWSHNTDDEGLVHLRVKNVAGYPRVSQVEVYSDRARTLLVAAGNASVPTGTGNAMMKLNRMNGSGLSGSVTISAQSADNTDISLALVPQLLGWRLRNLRTIWRRQDFPVDVYSEHYQPAAERRPIIDPDVVGPDDFRRPDAAQPPFALWRTRRQWIDQAVQDLASLTKTVMVGTQTLTVPDLDGVLARMYRATTYAATTTTPWSAATPVSEFDALGETLERGGSADVAATTDRVATDLNLAVDGFRQVLRIREKQRQWESDPKSEPVQPAEWKVLFSLLVKAQKDRLSAAWMEEEQAAAIRLGPEDFLRSQREPREGDWPPAAATGHPLIDPDEVRLTDLPEPAVGRPAILLWLARRAAVVDASAAIMAERESNGFDAMLRLALGHPASGDPLQHDLGGIRTDLASSNPATLSAATEKVTRDLHLTVENFNQLMTIKEKAAPSSPHKPAATEWTELYALLTTAHKIKHLSPPWAAEEAAAGLSTEYWRAVKARLPPVRATVEARREWQSALAVRSRPAIVDPDLVEVATFNGIGAEPAFTLWQARHDWVRDTITDMTAQPTTLAGFDAMAETTLSVPAADLVALVESREMGDGIQARLDQLPLTNAALVYLLRVRELLVAGQPVTTAEWESVYSILVQILKRRRSAQWRAEEEQAGVILSPNYFIPPDPTPSPAVSPAIEWRASQEDRYDWLNTLQSRVDQEISLLTSFHDVIGPVEEATLPALRDALVASAGVGADLSAKGAWVTDRLLIDAQAGPCQKTTRIAQAIESIQGLLFAVRTGQSAGLQTLGLTLNAPDFDEEWRWIGSYAPWRSAMFVFMYPENIAIGSLRRHQTPAFRRLVKAIRESRRLTNDQACALAAEYASYYEDVARLQIGATCQATVTEPSGTACVPGVISRKPLVFMFGRGGVSNGLYWSTFDPADTGGYAQSLWDLVPGAPPVAAVVGAWRYDRSPTDRRVFLFIRTTEYKLQFFTFDLESRAWAGPTDLGLPAGEPQSLDIVADQRSWRTTHPANLAVRSGRDIFVRPMNSAGTGWQDGDWKAFQISANSLNLDGIDIDKLFALEDYLWLGIRGQIEERFNGNSRSPDFNPRPWKDGEYIGGVEWNDSYFHVVQKRKSGVVEERVDPFYHGDPISDHFPMDGLRMIAPNIGGGADFAAFAYERRFEGWNPLSTDTEAEEDGVYLRLSFRYFAGDAPRFERYRIAPRVMPDVAGQFSIPARLDGPAVEQRRSTVKLTMSATSDSATNRIYAEEAYFFVPMLLCDGLRRAGEYAAAVDWAKTVYDYSRPPGEQKIYYGLIEEESLSALYTRTTDWLRDPLDPHAIAVTRGRTYTRFTLLSIVRLLLDFADDEFTRDTTETVPRARALYLAALTVLNSPELIQNTENCDEIIDAVDIPFDPGMPVKATVGVQGILSDLAGVTDYATLKALAPRVREVLASGSGWDERLVRARGLVDEVVRAEPPPTTVAGALELRAAATAHAFASVLTSPIVDRAALKVAQDAASQFRSSLESIPGLTEGLVETGSAALRWPRRSAVSTGARGVDFVFTPDLRPIAPPGSPSVAGLLAAASNGGSGRDAGQLPGPGGIRPPQGPPIIAAVVPSLAFCIPPNPLRGTLRMHAELNLLKLRTCRNIAGTKRELDPYAAPTDAVTGLPTIGASGQLVLAGTSVLRPTLYRFAALIQRAKELVALAQQIESAMLSAIEKHDAEAYSMLRARQDLELAQAGVQLQDLRLKQANDGVTLASLQATRAQIQLDHYQKLLDEGEIELERGAIEALEKAANLQVTASNLSFAAAALYGAAGIVGAVAGGVLGAGPGGVLGAALGALKDSAGVASGLAAASSGYSSLAAKTSTRAQIALTLASFERRKQDWELAASVAKQDVAIGAQQVTIAVDSVEISKQEKIIAEVTNTHAKDTVTFLANKFTNVDLYDWMGGVLESVYSFFLQQATSTARLAENQLAFERQEPPAGYIRSDYWQAPDDSLPTDTVQGAAPDRRGLTGSARLLQDLYRLDQYSFDTNKRKLQLSKTFSLALTAPTEFQRFRETGVMTFTTPMTTFDRDFPGHYLRLISKIRTSVVALIPPTEGIHASLSTAGVSRVVIGADVYQNVPIRRDPELVALTSPINASGVFELDTQSSGMLLPFEGTGVDTTWELRMPKASNFFDYRFISDVLITMDYTALNSWDYSQQVIQSLRQSTSGDRPLSFRNQLPDQWYALHNPDQTKTPMTVHFPTVRDDFPPNIDALKIQHVVLYFSRRDGANFEIPVTRLSFVEDGSPGATGGAATSTEGIISTRRGNAGSWMSFIGQQPFGEWELILPNTEEVKQRFNTEEIQDILFVMTYTGRTPEWPA